MTELAILVALFLASPGTTAAPASKRDAHPEERTQETSANSGPKKVGAESMCVTHGSLQGLHVSDAEMRAFVRGSQGDAGKIEFSYDGPTKQVSHLASDDVREQLGLKLRAEDGCNLIYVVWRFSPKPELVVQLKRNPGSHTNVECGTHGYERVRPSSHVSVAAPKPGSKHSLEASIHGDELTATVDGTVVWQGTLPASANELHGPIGVRTDNVEATLALTATLTESRNDDERCRTPSSD
jgi:hypothetical protein